MLTKEQNELLTHTGPGTPGGDLLRRFWQPVALSEEIPPGSAPKPLRVLSEDLVLFRDEHGHAALLGLHCPHRGVDLSYGRIEGGGLRCLYHGWVMAKDGRCLEQPGEPADSIFKDKVRHTAYPLHERNGLIFAYLGPGEPPPVPRFPFLVAAPESVWVTKLWHECNYLQGNEGNVDPQHLSILHHFYDPREQFRDSRVIMGGDLAPRLTVEETPFGLRTYAARTAGDTEVYVRISNFVMPNGSAFDGLPMEDPAVRPPLPNEGYQCHWHLPIDDTHHYKFVIVHRYVGAVSRDYMERSIKGELDEKYARPGCKENRYLQNRAEMLTHTYTGMGANFQDHDRFAVEAEGPLFDRSTERLGASDIGVIVMRRQMLQAIADLQAGREPAQMRTRGTDADPVAELVVRSLRIPKDAPVSGFWRSASTT
jgi:phenylpropionate dioxygenase-like ring-hydroxylating dioxygenase large terminal subunit